MKQKKIKILAVVGTNRQKEKSNTYKIIELLKQNLERRIGDNIQFDIFCFEDHIINVCKGCDNCFINGDCKLDKFDDMKCLKRKLLQSDCIIFGTPVYMVNIASPMKIIVDRLSYWSHTFPLRGKIYVPIVTTSRSGEDKTLDYMIHVGESFGMLPVSKIVYLEKNDVKDLVKDINKTAFVIEKYIKKDKTIKSNDDLEILFKLTKNDIKRQPITNYERNYWEKFKLINCNSFDDVLKMEMNNEED